MLSSMGAIRPRRLREGRKLEIARLKPDEPENLSRPTEVSAKGHSAHDGGLSGFSQKVVQFGETSLGTLYGVGVVSIQPAPMSSPVRTLPASISASCCSRLACSCLHQAMKRSVADMILKFSCGIGFLNPTLHAAG